MAPASTTTETNTTTQEGTVIAAGSTLQTANGHAQPLSRRPDENIMPETGSHHLSASMLNAGQPSAAKRAKREPAPALYAFFFLEQLVFRLPIHRMGWQAEFNQRLGHLWARGWLAWARNNIEESRSINAGDRAVTTSALVADTNLALLIGTLAEGGVD